MAIQSLSPTAYQGNILRKKEMDSQEKGVGMRREREKLTHREASLCISGDVSVDFRMCLSPWAFPSWFIPLCCASLCEYTTWECTSLYMSMYNHGRLPVHMLTCVSHAALPTPCMLLCVCMHFVLWQCVCPYDVPVPGSLHLPVSVHLSGAFVL